MKRIILAVLAVLITAGLITALNNKNVLFISKWVVVETLKKADYRVRNVFSGTSISDVQTVKNFIALQGEIEKLEDMAGQKSAQGLPYRKELSKLESLRNQQIKIKARTEAVIESQVRVVAGEESLFWLKSGKLKLFFPFPSFVIASAPNLLVLSPRSEIRIIESKILDGRLGFERIEELEKSAAEKNPSMSVLAVKTGGMATLFPASVDKSSSLRQMLQTAAHEWLHQYLFIKTNFGRSYFNSQETRTINETAVDIMGKELGDKIYLRFYASKTDKALIEGEAALSAGATRHENQEFIFDEFMNETRLKADEFLDNGEIEKAELYMEERRQELFRYGYFLRKLNQAYFAFYGTYSNTPFLDNPVGTTLKNIWNKSSSIADFINIIKDAESLEDLEIILASIN